jgi:hypothetical protein
MVACLRASRDGMNTLIGREANEKREGKERIERKRW